MEYILHIIILIGIYTILSVSLNLIAGYTGIMSIAHAAFYGIGAYVAALLSLKLSFPFPVNLVLAILLSTLFSALVAIPSLRIKDDYFVIATFAFQIITFNILNNWLSFTGGPMGLPGIPAPIIFGIRVTSKIDFLILVTIFCVFVIIISNLIIKSPIGRVLKAIREDEIIAQSFGKDVASFKVKIIMLGAGMAAIAGVIYASFISFIDPTSFTIMESIFIISIVIIGGAGNLFGPILGSVILVALPELLRFIGLPNSIAANIRQIFYGLLLVVFMLWRPKGLIGKYSFYQNNN